MKLQDRIALILGASSTLGCAIAQAFAEEGAKAILADADLASVESLCCALSEVPGEVCPIQIDPARREDVERAIDEAASRFGKLDILVNAATVPETDATIEEISDAAWQQALDGSLTAMMYACRHSITQMSSQERGGCIINVAHTPEPHRQAGLAYATVQYGLIGMTWNIGSSCAKQGIRCNAICSGQVQPWTAGFSFHERPLRLRQSCHSKGGPSPHNAEEVAAVALFLASDDASFVNGNIITADGGCAAG